MDLAVKAIRSLLGLALVGFSGSAQAQLPEDSTIGYFTQPVLAHWDCGRHFLRNERIRYLTGLRCDRRSTRGFCETVVPFYAIERMDRPHDRFVRFEQVRPLGGDGVLTAAEEFRRGIRKLGGDDSPFYGPVGMVTEGAGFAALLLFPLTVPVDILTAPLQLGAYWGERLLRERRYRSIPRNYRAFVLSGKSSPGVVIESWRGAASSGPSLKGLTSANLCPGRYDDGTREVAPL